MLTDFHLTLARPEDGAISQTKAVCLTQNDLTPPTDGVGPYEGLWLSVLAFDDVTALEVTLEHADEKDGPFTELVKYPAKDAKAGTPVLVAPVPFVCKNWLRVKLSAAAQVNALLTAGVDKTH